MRFCEIVGCPRPVFGTDRKTRIGYCKNHQHLRTDIDKDTIIQRAIKKQRHNAVPKIQTQLRKLYETDDVVREGSKDYDKLDLWFKERRKEMTGVCTECGKTTSKNNDKYYKWSICHIVPKSLVRSVATNPCNWIELCQQHHQEYDNTFDKAAAMMCFGEIKHKFQLFAHWIPIEELRKVNPHLLT